MKLSTLQKGLVLHMPLDRESLQSATVFADKTPHENVGTSANTPVFTTDRMGQSDRAMSFNGSTDYVDCGNDSSLDITNIITISTWIKTTSSKVRTEIANKGSVWMLSFSSNGEFRVYLYGTTPLGHKTTINPINDGNWHHVAFTYDKDGGANNLNLYIDGQVDAAYTLTGAIASNTNEAIISQGLTYSDRNFDGSIADIRIYNRAITPAEITALYEQYRPKILIKSQYGVSWDESANTYARTVATERFPCGSSPGNAYMPIQADMRRCVLSDAGVVQYYLDPDDSTKKADGTASDLTGGDGQVMVEIPKFYYKHGYSGTTHTWEIARGPIAGFALHPAFMKDGAEVNHRYIGAYDGSMWDATTSAMVPSGSITTNMYAAGDKLCSISGEYPKTNEMRSEFRAMGTNRGAGWRQLDFDLNSAIQLLYLVEYGDFDSQSMIGMGRTELSGGSWTAGSYIGQCGKSNSDGDGTNSVAGNTNNAYMAYRGIENWYGNVWKWNDGININAHVPYVTNNASAWADDTATGYTDLGVTLAAANNYQITLADTDRSFLPASVGADATYVSDYYYQSTGWRVVKLGGHAGNGADAGAFYLSAYDAASANYVHLGGRLAY